MEEYFSGPSYCEGGARWCIGSGSNIPILNEPWLSEGSLIDSNIAGAHFVQNFTVQSLIDASHKRWNSDVVQQVFSPDIAALILRTPLLDQVVEDSLVWKGEKNGMYSVRSAYRLYVDEIVDNTPLRRPGFWTGIWKLKVPPKVKNLIWRMCRGCLPTRVRLQDKGVQCPMSCVICNDPAENLDHICFLCPFSMQVWQRIGLWNSIQQAYSNVSSAEDVIFELMRRLSPELSQRLAVILWSLWKHRNLKLWQNESETCAQVIDRAVHLLDDWSEANYPPEAAAAPNDGATSGNASSSVRSSSNVRWQRPQRGRLKCNVDASFSETMNRTGIGICIRDDEGTFVLARTVCMPSLMPIPVGEALGLYHALEWVSDMQFDNVDFALDSKITTDAFSRSSRDISEFGQVISECRRVFSTHFTNSKVEFCRRQANGVAHALARVAKLYASPTIYYDVPLCIEQIIINEML